MDFTNDQLKSLKERFCREKIQKAISTERQKKPRVKKVSWDEMNIISSPQKSVNQTPRMYYIRVTSQGATPITKDKYLLESECCPDSWSYAWGTKREILEFCKRHNIIIKGELI